METVQIWGEKKQNNKQEGTLARTTYKLHPRHNHRLG